jgi:hypothetical protein
MIEHGPTNHGPLRREQGRDAGPLFVGQRDGRRSQYLDRRGAATPGGQTCPSGGMTAFGGRLMAAAKCRSGETKGKALGGLDQREEEATNLRDGQG